MPTQKPAATPSSPDPWADIAVDPWADAEPVPVLAPSHASTAAPPPDWVDALPTVLGTGASMLAGSKMTPTGVGAAALGGGVGQAARILVRAAQGEGRYPGAHALSVGGAMKEAAGSIAEQAGAQAGGELVGQAIGAPLSAIGRALYGKVALRPIQNVMDKYGYKAVRDMGYDEAAIAGSPRHARLNLEKLRQGVAETKRIEQAYDAAGGTPLDVRQAIEAPLRQLANKSQRMGRNVAGQTDESAQVISELDRVANTTPTMRAQDMGQALRDSDEVSSAAFEEARKTHRAMTRPADPATVAQATGHGYRTKLRQALTGTDWKDKKAENATRYGLQRALERSYERPEHLTTLMAGGIAAAGNPGAALAMRVGALPVVSSSLAIYGPRMARRTGQALAGGAFSSQAGAASDALRDELLRAMDASTEPP